MLDCITLAASNPMEHLLQRHMLFDFIHLPDVLWKDWIAGGLGISKPVLYMWAAAALVCAVFIPMAKKWQHVPRGIQRLFEPLLLFVRDAIVRENIRAPHDHHHGHGDDHGHHHVSHEEQREKDRAVADSYLPLCWTLFFFILFMNLVGLTPHAITPTGQFSVTLGLALVSAVVIIGSGMRSNGGVGYWVGLVPPDIPKFFAGVIPNPIWLLVFVVEFVGLFFKPFALCIRLMANMTGGHVIILALLGFAVGAHLFHPFFGVDGGMSPVLGIPIAIISVVAAAVITGFEIIIALVQAYVFTLLTATFIGMAVAPEH